MPDEPEQTNQAADEQGVLPTTEPTPAGAADEPEPTAVLATHPGHALIDEIVSNIKVQHNPGWIKGKLEELRKLL